MNTPFKFAEGVKFIVLMLNFSFLHLFKSCCVMKKIRAYLCGNSAGSNLVKIQNWKSRLVRVEALHLCGYLEQCCLILMMSNDVKLQRKFATWFSIGQRYPKSRLDKICQNPCAQHHDCCVCMHRSASTAPPCRHLDFFFAVSFCRYVNIPWSRVPFLWSVVFYQSTISCVPFGVAAPMCLWTIETLRNIVTCWHWPVPNDRNVWK